MNWVRWVVLTAKSFGRQNDGAVAAETLLIAPFIVIFLAGILEFGGFLYAKLEAEAGLRDGARYLARCRDLANTVLLNEAKPLEEGVVYGCNEEKAKNLAVFYSPEPAVDAVPRVSGMTLAAITISAVEVENSDGAYNSLNDIEDVYILRLDASFNYPGGPLIGLIGLASLPVTAYHEERYIGW